MYIAEVVIVEKKFHLQMTGIEKRIWHAEWPSKGRRIDLRKINYNESALRTSQQVSEEPPEKFTKTRELLLTIPRTGKEENAH